MSDQVQISRSPIWLFLDLVIIDQQFFKSILSTDDTPSFEIRMMSMAMCVFSFRTAAFQELRLFDEPLEFGWKWRMDYSNEVKKFFLDKGFNISDAWLDDIIEYLRGFDSVFSSYNARQAFAKVYSEFLDADVFLSLDKSKPSIPENITKSTENCWVLSGERFVQLVSSVNLTMAPYQLSRSLKGERGAVAAASPGDITDAEEDAEEDGNVAAFRELEQTYGGGSKNVNANRSGPRTLMMCFTDGHQVFYGVEDKSLPIVDEPARGSKFVLKDVQIRKGLAFLTPSNTVLMGGSVQKTVVPENVPRTTTTTTTTPPTSLESTSVVPPPSSRQSLTKRPPVPAPIIPIPESSPKIKSVNKRSHDTIDEEELEMAFGFDFNKPPPPSKEKKEAAVKSNVPIAAASASMINMIDDDVFDIDDDFLESPLAIGSSTPKEIIKTDGIDAENSVSVVNSAVAPSYSVTHPPVNNRETGRMKAQSPVVDMIEDSDMEIEEDVSLRKKRPFVPDVSKIFRVDFQVLDEDSDDPFVSD